MAPKKSELIGYLDNVSSFIFSIIDFIDSLSESLMRYDTVVFIFFQDNKLNGPAMIFAANGDRIELSYENGVVNGKATIKGMSLKCFSSRYMFNTLGATM